MIFIHGMNDPSYPRLVDHSMGKRLRVMPAVVVSGARQTGKSTLAGEPTPGRRRYVSLDDINIVDAARRDPGLLVDGDEPVGSIVNQTELGRDVALPQPTVHRHLNLLETSYLLVRLAPYSVNRTKRLVKSPKLHWGDTGVGLHLAGKTEPGGEHLGNLILNDLLAWRDAQRKRSEILYWRTTLGEEVDFVIEAGDRVLPIEIKATGRPRLEDVRHLRTFRAEYAKNCRAGLLLYGGSTLERIASDVLAVPWWRVL